MNYFGVDEFSVIITKEKNDLSQGEIREIERKLIELYKENGYKMYNVLKDTRIKLAKPFINLT